MGIPAGDDQSSLLLSGYLGNLETLEVPDFRVQDNADSSITRVFPSDSSEVEPDAFGVDDVRLVMLTVARKWVMRDSSWVMRTSHALAGSSTTCQPTRQCLLAAQRDGVAKSPQNFLKSDARQISHELRHGSIPQKMSLLSSTLTRIAHKASGLGFG